MDARFELKALLLAPPRLTLAVAESLTAGRVQAGIAAVPGASDYFLGGLTAYSLAQKVRLLGVDRAHARRVNSVSARVAVEMARGACRLFGADLAVATTGYAQPDAARAIDVPMAHWAIVHRRARRPMPVRQGSITLPGATRIQAQTRVADEVLRALAAYLRWWRAQKNRRA